MDTRGCERVLQASGCSVSFLDGTCANILGIIRVVVLGFGIDVLLNRRQILHRVNNFEPCVVKRVEFLALLRMGVLFQFPSSSNVSVRTCRPIWNATKFVDLSMSFSYSSITASYTSSGV